MRGKTRTKWDQRAGDQEQGAAREGGVEQEEEEMKEEEEDWGRGEGDEREKKKEKKNKEKSLRETTSSCSP